MPASVWFCVATLSSATGTTAHLVAMIAWTLGLAVIWSELGLGSSPGNTCQMG
jgi:hypothetical protein